MKPYEGQGYWWLPGKEDKKVPGVIKFDDKDGAVLTLIGSLSRWGDRVKTVRDDDTGAVYELTEESGSNSKKYARIYGESRGSRVTLEDCLELERQSEGLLGSKSQTIYAKMLIKNIHFGDETPVEANALEIEMAYLNEWASESRITRAMERPQNKVKVNKIELHARINEDRSVKLQDGITLTLIHDVTDSSGDGFSTLSLTQTHKVRIESNATVSLERLTDVASDFQDLVSVATLRNAEFLSIKGFHPEATLNRRDKTLPDIFMPFDIMSRWSIKDTHKEAGKISQNEFCFSLEDLGGMDGIARWMNIARTYRSILGRTMITHAHSGGFPSDRLLNYTATIERFSREKYKTTENDTLASILLNCSISVGTIFSDFTGDVNKWSNAVKNHRHDIAHHRAESSASSASEQYYLAESLYWLLVLLLLKEAEALSDCSSRIIDNENFNFIGGRIRPIVKLEKEVDIPLLQKSSQNKRPRRTRRSRNRGGQSSL